VQQHHHAEPFHFPVKTSVAPDYYDVIKNPMDLDTMLNKTKYFQYYTITQFWSDFELIEKNCHFYNQGTSSAYLIEWVTELKQVFMSEINKCSKDLEIHSSYFGDTTEQMEQIEQLEPNDQIEPIDQIDSIDPIDTSNLEESGYSETHRGSLQYIIDNDYNWDMVKTDGIFDCSLFPDHTSQTGHFYDQVHETFDFGRYM